VNTPRWEAGGWTALVAWRGDRANREIASQGLINFLVHNYPESLPRSRNVSVDDEKTASPARTVGKHKDEVTPGAQHERGSKSPGVHAEEKSDGAE
jgi:hypothetical protein